MLDESYWEGRNPVYISPYWTYVSPTKWTYDTITEPLSTNAATATIIVGDNKNEI